jgi:hypothetical protein
LPGLPQSNVALECLLGIDQEMSMPYFLSALDVNLSASQCVCSHVLVADPNDAESCSTQSTHDVMERHYLGDKRRPL